MGVCSFLVRGLRGFELHVAHSARFWVLSPCAFGHAPQCSDRRHACTTLVHKVATHFRSKAAGAEGARALRTSLRLCREHNTAADGLPSRLKLDHKIRARLVELEARYAKLLESSNEVASLSSAGIAALHKQLHQLEPVCSGFEALKRLQKEEEDLRSLLHDADAAVREEAAVELRQVSHAVSAAEHDLVLSLLPGDDADERDVVLEVKAGAGGEEASLFASELFDMYRKFAQEQQWRWEAMSGAGATLVATIGGDRVYASLKFENGVHRIQRVPVTEAKGRTHTSTATVLVMPEADEVDVSIDVSDLKVETMRASGAGGQHVNTTDSAVRVTHLPTGIVAHVSDERSQHRNRDRALRLISARVADHERQKMLARQASERKSLLGSGDRSERIRTYNFSENRITDHRIGLSRFGMEEMLAGVLLPDFIAALGAQDKLNRILALQEGQ